MEKVNKEQSMLVTAAFQFACTPVGQLIVGQLFKDEQAFKVHLLKMFEHVAAEATPKP